MVDGSLDVVTTDHSTYLVAEKERGWQEIFRSPSGAPGVQTLLPIMVTAALQGRLSLEQVVKLICSEPARLFGLASRKGVIQPGADADLCLYDPRQPTVFGREQMWSQARDVDKLYEGVALQGQVVATWVRGRLVYRDGEILAPAGSGRFIIPA